MERGIITITESGAVMMPTAPVWMTQQEMSDAFNVFGCYIRKAIASIYKNNELSEEETVRHVRQDGRICYDVYSLEMVVAVAFRLRHRLEVCGTKNSFPSFPSPRYFSMMRSGMSSSLMWHSAFVF